MNSKFVVCNLGTVYPEARRRAGGRGARELRCRPVCWGLSLHKFVGGSPLAGRPGSGDDVATAPTGQYS